MRDFKLILDKPSEVKQAVSAINDSIQIYKKKIKIYEKRKEFRRQNQCFELFRRRFYRNLSEEDKNFYDVSNNEIKEYWSTMWEKDQKTVINDELSKGVQELVMTPIDVNLINTYLISAQATKREICSYRYLNYKKLLDSCQTGKLLV